MPSDEAKKVAGTYVPDEVNKLSETMAWLTKECRSGSLSEHVAQFCNEQREFIDKSLVIVENVTSDCIHCRIPCRCYDHEDAGTFPVDVRFTLNPKTGACARI
jgi:hypothetical protein